MSWPMTTRARSIAGARNFGMLNMMSKASTTVPAMTTAIRGSVKAMSCREPVMTTEPTSMLTYDTAPVTCASATVAAANAAGTPARLR